PPGAVRAPAPLASDRAPADAPEAPPLPGRRPEPAPPGHAHLPPALGFDLPPSALSLGGEPLPGRRPGDREPDPGFVPVRPGLPPLGLWPGGRGEAVGQPPVVAGARGGPGRIRGAGGRPRRPTPPDRRGAGRGPATADRRGHRGPQPGEVAGRAPRRAPALL